MMNTIVSEKIIYERNTSVKQIRRSVKSLTGFDLRRMDSFTLIAIEASYLMLKNKELQGTTGLYGVANHFSVDLLQSLLISVEKKQDIRPFDFILSVGNAANFYIAKQFNLRGPNIFLGASESTEVKTLELINVDADAGLIDSAIYIYWRACEKNIECQVKLLSKNNNLRM